MTIYRDSGTQGLRDSGSWLSTPPMAKGDTPGLNPPRAGPSTFGALGKLHSWRPPTKKKHFYFSKLFSAKTELQLSNAILPCKTAFLSHKHNNDRDDEQTLIQEQITEKMSRLCWTMLRPRP